MKPSLRDLDADLFVSWLRRHGAVIEAPGADHIALRFRTAKGTGLVFQNRKRVMTHANNVATGALKSMRTGDPWRGAAIVRVKRDRPTVRSLMDQAVMS